MYAPLCAYGAGARISCEKGRGFKEAQCWLDRGLWRTFFAQTSGLPVRFRLGSGVTQDYVGDMPFISVYFTVVCDSFLVSS